jgi:YD repeat-containing protein
MKKSSARSNIISPSGLRGWTSATRSEEKAMIALFGVGPKTKPQFNITLLGVLIAVIIGLAIDQARAEPQTRFYDSQGRSIGTAAPYGNGSVRYYDAYGRSLGTSTTTGNTTRFYDASGRSAGSAEGIRRPFH